MITSFDLRPLYTFAQSGPFHFWKTYLFKPSHKQSIGKSIFNHFDIMPACDSWTNMPIRAIAMLETSMLH